MFSGMAMTMAVVERHIGVSAMLMGEQEAVIPTLTDARVAMLQ